MGQFEDVFGMEAKAKPPRTASFELERGGLKLTHWFSELAEFNTV